MHWFSQSIDSVFQYSDLRDSTLRLLLAPGVYHCGGGPVHRFRRRESGDQLCLRQLTA